MSFRPSHFYVAFNPLFNSEDSSYKTQAHEFHYLLKEKVKSNHQSHMYWGKLKVADYSEPLDIERFKKVLKTNETNDCETQLYISDYQHLWVAKVSEVCSEISDYENTMDFYKEKNVEVWFKITDFDLVSHDANSTARRLSYLYVENEYYHYKIKEMTPLSTGLRFPMILQDRKDERYFRDFDHSISHRLKLDNTHIISPGESMMIKNMVHTYVIPEKNFKKLPEVVKGLLVNAEMLIVESTVKGKKDRSKLEHAILMYIKALEVLLNETFVAHLKKEQGHRIFVTAAKPTKFLRSAFEKDKNEVLMLKESQDIFGLVQIKMLLDAPTFFPHTTLDWTFREKKKFWEYCRLELRHILKNESLAELRNTLTLGGNITANDRELLFVRNVLLGVGDKGVFNDIVETYCIEEYQIQKTA